MAKIKNEIFCAKCDTEMKLAIIPKYEFEEGYPLYNVQAYKCSKCDKIFFTEELAKELELKTKERKENTFGFLRKITISGKSLVVGIPAELAEYLHIKQGQKVKIIPVAKKGFFIEKVAG